MGFLKTPGPSVEQVKLANEQKKRETEQRVELARERDRQDQDRQGFRRKLRGVFSLLSGNFKGFGSGDDKETLG